MGNRIKKEVYSVSVEEAKARFRLGSVVGQRQEQGRGRGGHPERGRVDEVAETLEEVVKTESESPSHGRFLEAVAIGLDSSSARVRMGVLCIGEGTCKGESNSGKRIPVGGIPAGGMPVGGMPVGGMPVGGMPVRGMPVGGIPVGGMPVGGIPPGDIAAKIGANNA